MKINSILLLSIVFFSSVSLKVSSAENDCVYKFERGLNISHWLGQHLENKYADPYRFSRADAKWIADKQFDHIRIPVDGRILVSIEGKLINELLEPFDQALEWSAEHCLGVILDMHFLPGAHFLVSAKENKLWQNKQLQNVAISLWQQLANKYSNIGPILRYELLNEAVAPKNEQVNDLNRKLVAAVRQVDKKRIVYVSSNEQGKFKHAESVYVFKDDPNVHYVFHYYDPMIFTHQHASWSEHTQYYSKDIAFPSQVENLEPYFPKGFYMLNDSGKRIGKEQIDKDFDQLGAWAKKHGVKILISEFGVIHYADPESTINWMKAIREACLRNQFGWTVWDYKGAFAVSRDGKTTAVWQGLFQ